MNAATILKSIVGYPFDHHCQAKQDTITTNAIFSFNGRRLVTSLILVITTIILLILLIVNLNCIIFTEATVNTTATSLISQSSSSPITLSFDQTTSQSPLVNKSVGGDVDTGSSTQASKSNHSIAGVILSKIRNSELNTTGSSGIMANTATTGSSQMADNNSTGSTQLSPSEEDARNELCAALTSDGNNVTSSTNETTRYFDIDYASKTFEDSMADKNAISLHHYLNGFKELMKFFHSLGTIFLFVTSDLENKIGLLEGYRNTERGGCNPAYLTIQSAIEYETKENLLRDAKRQSGARTILRLHRALEFLSALMLNLSRLDYTTETAPAAREAYTNTLAKHHPWTIRTIASFAMRTLPRKKILVESVLGKENSTNDTLTDEKMLLLANVTENLFNVVDKYYEENNIKDLP